MVRIGSGPGFTFSPRTGGFIFMKPGSPMWKNGFPGAILSKPFSWKGFCNMWKYYALLSAVFAALTAILAKVGVRDIDSNLATAIRTTVILAITWGVVLAAGVGGKLRELTGHNLLFLVLSGIATGLSWLFYFKALQTGDASKVAPIDKLSVAITIFLGVVVLHEQVSWNVIVGGLLIVGGSLVILL